MVVYFCIKSLLFNVQALHTKLGSDFVEGMRTPANLGHFEKVYPLFQSNVMNPF